MSRIKSVEILDAVTVVRLGENVTFTNLNDVQDDFARATKGIEINNIVFDLKEVDLADSAGVAGLINFLQYMRSHGKKSRVALANVSERVRSLLVISKTEYLFEVFGSVSTAVAELKVGSK